MSTSLQPDQGQHCTGLDLGSNSLQKVSTQTKVVTI